MDRRRFLKNTAQVGVGLGIGNPLLGQVNKQPELPMDPLKSWEEFKKYWIDTGQISQSSIARVLQQAYEYGQLSDVENSSACVQVLKNFGYEYHSRFSEEPEIRFFVKKDGEYELRGHYHTPAPCINIDDDGFWQYEDAQGEFKAEGTGAQKLIEFLMKGIHAYKG